MNQIKYAVDVRAKRHDDRAHSVMPGQAAPIWTEGGNTFFPMRTTVYTMRLFKGQILTSQGLVEEDMALSAMSGSGDSNVSELLHSARVQGECAGSRILRAPKHIAPGVFPESVVSSPERPYVETRSVSVLDMLRAINGCKQSNVVSKPLWLYPHPEGNLELFDTSYEEIRKFKALPVPFMAEPFEYIFDEDSAYEATLSYWAYITNFKRLMSEVGTKEIYLGRCGQPQEIITRPGDPGAWARNVHHMLPFQTGTDDPWSWFHGGGIEGVVRDACRGDWHADVFHSIGVVFPKTFKEVSGADLDAQDDAFADAFMSMEIAEEIKQDPVEEEDSEEEPVEEVADPEGFQPLHGFPVNAHAESAKIAAVGKDIADEKAAEKAAKTGQKVEL